MSSFLLTEYIESDMKLGAYESIYLDTGFVEDLINKYILIALSFGQGLRKRNVIHIPFFPPIYLVVKLV